MTTKIMTLATSPRVAKELKKDGSIPAVFYGAQTKSTPIFINSIEFTKVFEHAGESTAITLETEAGKLNVLVHDVQFDPVKNFPTHVDFYVIEKGQKVHVKVPVEFIGEAPAVKTGGVLVKVMHELSVEGETMNIPHEITIDVSSLVANDSVITVADVKLPKGVELYHVESTEVIASISAQKEESETVEAVDLSSIEVEQKGKKEEEAESAE